MNLRSFLWSLIEISLLVKEMKIFFVIVNGQTDFDRSQKLTLNTSCSGELIQA